MPSRVDSVGAKIRRAATYVRMSTEHQQYSIANQSDAIETYAAQHKLNIVKRFVDAGKSGLTLAGRPALRALLMDVISGKAEVDDVLVYDVSRWGRFQDADEAAYYEYSCRKAGVKLHYCVEQFENDGSPYSNLIKALKRTMAGEFSRELSVKVFAGQVRLVNMGYRQGGSPGYGLRRSILDIEGKQKILKCGERKSLQSDRVILVPGPKKEVALLRQIFHWFAVERMTEQGIANLLNARRIKVEPGLRHPDAKWSRARIHQVLTNPKYIGANLYNRKSYKLHKKAVRNPVDQWVRKDGAYKSIIPADLFMRTQALIQLRNQVMSDEVILQRLRFLLKRAGRLTANIINQDVATPSVCTIQRRFGSLPAAYKLIDYKPKRSYKGFGKRRSDRRPVRKEQPMIEEIREAVECGRLSKTFSVSALRNACPGWASSSYNAFVGHYSNPEYKPLLFERLSRGIYRLLEGF